MGENDYEFYNYGTITNDNKTICRSIFYKVSDLVFNQNVNPKDIIVIAQWTTLIRNSWFVSPSKYPEISKLDIQKYGKHNRPLPHTTDYLTFEDKKHVYQHGYFYMTGGSLIGGSFSRVGRPPGRPLARPPRKRFLATSVV